MKLASHLSAQELAAQQLPGFPKTKRGINKLARSQNWPSRPRSGKGGGVEYPIVCLPVLLRNALCDIALGTAVGTGPKEHDLIVQEHSQISVASEIGANVSSAKASGSWKQLTDWQKRTAEARAALLQEVDRLAVLVGREKAIMKVVIMAQDGTLPEPLAGLVPIANARSGNSGKRTLSRRTLHRWIGEAKTTDGERRQVNSLAPKKTHGIKRVPEWVPELLEIFQQPQNPSLTWAVEQIAPRYGIDQHKLYHRARRFLEKMGSVERQVGRMGPRELKNIKPFIRRDSSVLWPADVYSADGHTFDAEVAHPKHGGPFRPELTTVRDIATRKVVGWSVDLAESGLAVLDALRHACETGGICSLFYVDHGSGYDNVLQSAPGVGLEARLGYTKTHSLPYNSQARGVVEKGHKDIWVRAAKELPTYMGADMDAEAKNKVYKITRKDIKQHGSSKHLMPWLSFLNFVTEQAEKYNNRPHRSLSMVSDPVLGRKRHMTPNEAWEAGVKAGAQLVMISPEESRDLFRPMSEVKVVRGEVRLFNNFYFSTELTEYHGDVVRVAYDIHCADLVWVYDDQGRFICTAEFEANKRAYFPETFLEQAARKRAEGRAARLERKLDEVREELEGSPLKDVAATAPALENNASPTLRLVDRENVASVADVPSINESAKSRPVFLIDSERYEWLMEHRDAWTDADQRFLRQYVEDPQGYAQLAERFELLGIAWDEQIGKEVKQVV